MGQMLLPGTAHERIVSQLRKEHSWLRRLVHSAARVDLPRRRAELAQSIRHHWLAHAHAEERCIYRLLERHAQTAPWVEAGREEQARIDALVAQLLRVKSSSVDWGRTAAELASAIDDHLHTEEMGVISRMPVVLRERDAEQAQRRYARLRVALGEAAPS